MRQLETKLRGVFGDRVPRLVEAAENLPRAAVAMILAPGETEGAEVLFIRRAELDGDPWSGHMAFPGGRQSAADADLIETARRETREETGMEISREDVVGRLDDLYPSSPDLPPIVIAPFVVWIPEQAEIEPNHEIAGHVWVPFGALSDPVHRSSFTLHRDDRTRIFETIEYEGHTIWGLTFNIVSQFVMALANAGLPDR